MDALPKALSSSRRLEQADVPAGPRACRHNATRRAPHGRWSATSNEHNGRSHGSHRRRRPRRAQRRRFARGRVAAMPATTSAPVRAFTVEAARRKGTGSTKNGRDSNLSTAGEEVRRRSWSPPATSSSASAVTRCVPAAPARVPRGAAKPCEGKRWRLSAPKAKPRASARARAFASQALSRARDLSLTCRVPLVRSDTTRCTRVPASAPARISLCLRSEAGRCSSSPARRSKKTAARG